MNSAVLSVERYCEQFAQPPLLAAFPDGQRRDLAYWLSDVRVWVACSAGRVTGVLWSFYLPTPGPTLQGLILTRCPSAIDVLPGGWQWREVSLFDLARASWAGGVVFKEPGCASVYFGECAAQRIKLGEPFPKKRASLALGRCLMAALCAVCDRQ